MQQRDNKKLAANLCKHWGGNLHALQKFLQCLQKNLQGVQIFAHRTAFDTKAINATGEGTKAAAHYSPKESNALHSF